MILVMVEKMITINKGNKITLNTDNLSVCMCVGA